jgi:hypothetical protein
MDYPEEWRQIPGFDGNEASSLGRVRRGNKYLRVSLDSSGYPRVCIRGAYRTIHQLVLIAFVGARPKGMESCHNNGIRVDCRLENLRWDTRSNNLRDRHAHGNGFVKHGRYCGIEPNKVLERKLRIGVRSLYGVISRRRPMPASLLIENRT